nr:DNA/RNA non-specific endonuclease [Clostridium sp.]
MAPHKVVFNSSELVINIYAAIEGGVGIVSAVKNIPKLISGGLKVAGFTNGALSITRDLSIATIAGAVSKTGAYGIVAESAVNNAIGNSNSVEYGEQYTKGKNGRKELKPNVEYTTPGGHTYSTDELGRIKEVNGTLSRNKAKRNPYDQKVAGREDRLSTDDGGHLIASIFDGSGDLDNMVPMDSTLNRGDWKAMENSWARALKEDPPKTVEVKISPQYSGSSTRPIAFDVKYRIGNGRWIKETFRN